jgi:2'-5' RNA ligase
MTTKSISTLRVAPAVAGIGVPSQGDRHRLFFALMPDANVRVQIGRAVEHLRAQHHPAGRWIAPERYHLTLHFLGDESELRPELVDRAMSAGKKVRAPEINLRIDGATSFPGNKPPWVMCCLKDTASLHGLWRDLAAALASEQVRSDCAREFIPHVTVLRDADKALAPYPIDPIAWKARDFALIHSQLGAVQRYTELARWPLDKSP